MIRRYREEMISEKYTPDNELQTGKAAQSSRPKIHTIVIGISIIIVISSIIIISITSSIIIISSSSSIIIADTL